MFKIYASHTETADIHASFDEVRDFFTDIKNFIELMPNVESIHEDAKGITHWKIRADIPFVGSMHQKFLVEEVKDQEERVEYRPAPGEEKNLMKYSADFIEVEDNLTTVRFSQTLELRRNSAMELHFLAGLAGESIISSEMQRRIEEMVKDFIEHVRETLEE